jgi:hypothetical protein
MIESTLIARRAGKIGREGANGGESNGYGHKSEGGGGRDAEQQVAEQATSGKCAGRAENESGGNQDQGLTVQVPVNSLLLEQRTKADRYVSQEVHVRV